MSSWSLSSKSTDLKSCIANSNCYYLIKYKQCYQNRALHFVAWLSFSDLLMCAVLSLGGGQDSLETWLVDWLHIKPSVSPTCGARLDEEGKEEEEQEGYWDRVLVPRDTLCSASAETLIRLCGLRMLTRQNAEPLLGMKLTLFLSGHKNCGISRGGLALRSAHTKRTRRKAVRISRKTQSQLSKPCTVITSRTNRCKKNENKRGKKREKGDKQAIRRSTDCVSSVKTLTRSQPSGGSRLNM